MVKQIKHDTVRYPERFVQVERIEIYLWCSDFFSFYLSCVGESVGVSRSPPRQTIAVHSPEQINVLLLVFEWQFIPHC